MKQLLLLPFLFTVYLGFCQTRIYTGFIDKYPITFVTNADINQNDNAEAIYVYDNFDAPILIEGSVSSGTLILYKLDSLDNPTETFAFEQFNPKSETLIGKWTSLSKKKSLVVTLTKTNQFYDYDDSAFSDLEILTQSSTDEHYFKLLLAKKTDEEVKVSGVRIYEKKTDRLIQQVPLDCEFRLFTGVFVNDYNFDGLTDFSVFEQAYAGINFSYKYVLRESNSEKYFISEFEGSSLEFDKEKKEIVEHNQCCGSQHVFRTYKIIDNKMVLLSQKCFTYSEEEGDLVEITCDN